MRTTSFKLVALIAALSLLAPAIALCADVAIETVPPGEKIYTGVKLLGVGPLLLEDYRSGALALRLSAGDPITVDVPTGDATVNVLLNTEVTGKPNFLETGARWFIVGAIAAGIVGLAILVFKPETSSVNPG